MKSRLAIYGLLGLTVCGLAYWRHGGEDADAPSRAEIADAVGDRTYTVRCEGCSHNTTMFAATYIDNLSHGQRGQGLPCPQCKANKLWKVGVAVEMDASAASDIERLSSSTDLRRALREASYEAARLEARLADSAVSSDPQAVARIRQELVTLRAREDLLDRRLSQIASESR